MVKDPDAPEGFSLKRWSRRKLDAARGGPPAAAPSAAATSAPGAAVAPPPPATTAAGTPAQSAQSAPEAALPPLDTLNFDSDLTAFFQPKVDESTKRAALKKLLSDPRFNVMDGLDIYIDDYGKPDPMPAGMLDRLANIYQRVTETADPAGTAAGTAPPSSGDAKGHSTAAAPAPEGGGEDAGAAEPAPATLAAPEPGDDATALHSEQAQRTEAAPPNPPARTGKSA